jgi:ankyrin repeat protein
VDGRVISFGKRSHLGRENGSSSLEPVKIDEPVSYISTGYNHSMVIARSGVVYAWGSGRDGQLGHLVKNSSKHPIKIFLLGNNEECSYTEEDSETTMEAKEQPSIIQACAAGSKRGSYTFLLSATTHAELKNNGGKLVSYSRVLYIKFKSAIKEGDKAELVSLCENEILSWKKKLKGLNIISRYNRPELIATMIARGCMINKVYKSGKTPLQVAAQYGSIAVLKALLIAGAIVDFRNYNEETALHAAAREGQLSAVVILVQHGASVVARDCQGNTALHIAISKHQNQVLEYLLEENFECLELKNHKGQTPLHTAVLSHNAEALKALCFRGANTEAKDTKGNTPLYYAVVEKFYKLIRKLLNYNANRHAKTSQGASIEELANLDPNIARLLNTPPNEDKYDSSYSEKGTGMRLKNLVFQGGGIKGLAYIGGKYYA